MHYKVVTDSSANMLSLDDVDFAMVPLHIIIGEQEFVDDENVDIAQMQTVLDQHKGKSSTSCPSPQQWLSAFGDADTVFCVTITSGLSGCYTAAEIAKEMYESSYPDRKVYVLDTLSTGPEMYIILEKLRQLILEGLEPDKIYETLSDYRKNTHLCFSLASVNNFAKNGRVNPIIAKGVGLLGIRIFGQASSEGTLQILDKCRGDKKSLNAIIHYMSDHAYKNGRVVIAHNGNEQGANTLKELILAEFGAFNGVIHNTRALCSYYAEPESILVGFEA